MQQGNESIDRAIMIACKDDRQRTRVREEIRSYMEMFHSFGWIKTKEETHESQIAFINSALDKINRKRDLIKLVVSDPDVCLFLEKHVDFFNCESDSLCRLFNEEIQKQSKDDMYEEPDDPMVQLICRVFDGQVVTMPQMPYRVVISEGAWDPIDIIDTGFIEGDFNRAGRIDEWKSAEVLVL
jgi:hypothetical protein